MTSATVTEDTREERQGSGTAVMVCSTQMPGKKPFKPLKSSCSESEASVQSSFPDGLGNVRHTWACNGWVTAIET